MGHWIAKQHKGLEYCLQKTTLCGFYFITNPLDLTKSQHYNKREIVTFEQGEKWRNNQTTGGER